MQTPRELPESDSPPEELAVFSDGRIPTAADFSLEAARKARRQDAWRSKITRYLPVLPATLLGAGVVLGFSEILILLLALSGGFCSFAWLQKFVFGAKKFERQYFEKLKAIARRKTDQKKEMLKQGLISQGRSEAAEQFDRFQSKFDNIVGILLQKLNSTELTFQRYYGIVFEVFCSGIDNLNDIYLTLSSVSAVDPGRLGIKLNHLRHHADQNDEETRREIKASEEGLELYSKQLEKAERLFQENEIAMGELDKAATVIAEMDTGQAQSIGMEDAMQALKDITERNKQSDVMGMSRI